MKMNLGEVAQQQEEEDVRRKVPAPMHGFSEENQHDMPFTYAATTPNTKGIEKDGLKYSAAQTAAAKKFWALLAVSVLVLLAAGAVFAALYAPNHMPQAIGAIVNGLSPIALQGITIGATAVGTLGVAGLASAAYNGKDAYFRFKDLSNLGIFNNQTNAEIEDPNLDISERIDVKFS